MRRDDVLQERVVDVVRAAYRTHGNGVRKLGDTPVHPEKRKVSHPRSVIVQALRQSAHPE